MTHDKAIEISRALAEAGISHTITIGIAENYVPRVSAHVELPALRRIRGGIREAVIELDDLATAHGLVLETTLLSHGITFSEAPGDVARAVGELLR